MRNMYKYLPYKLTKRISKTGEARSGLEIYKRRNSRSYRGIMQYKTWKKFIKIPVKITATEYVNNVPENIRKIYDYFIFFNEIEKINYPNLWKTITLTNPPIEENILPNFREGYVVLITPEEYFGNNYPNKSSSLHPRFIIGETGFVYYSSEEEFNKYKPLYSWNEVYELNTKGNHFNEPKTWKGEYVLNIKNTAKPKISKICKKSNSEDEIKQIFDTKFPEIKNPPQQAGLGNYDYDYASSETIENVKYQMLYLALSAKEKDGTSFFEYLKENYKILEDKNDKSKEGKYKEPYKTLFNDSFYCYSAEKQFDNFKEECESKGLLDFEKLWEIGAWDKNKNVPVCPLCGKPIEPHEFFEGVEQAEGREVSDNTQRAIVLMHINALKPGELNHRPYNLGWGHNFCNTIQGDKDISVTIEELKKIISNYEAHHNK